MITIPVSIGELLDKITILEIKLRRIPSEEKRANIGKELNALDAVLAAAELPPLDELKGELTAVNERLWDIEDRIRLCEKAGEFGEEFIELARSVYIENDQRSEIKRRINLRTGSDLIEEKSYEEYGRG